MSVDVHMRVVYHELALEVRCRSYRCIMLPTLGRYIREDALFALCCASLLKAGPVWFIFFAFLILGSDCLLLYLLVNLIFVSVLCFHKISFGTGASQ